MSGTTRELLREAEKVLVENKVVKEATDRAHHRRADRQGRRHQMMKIVRVGEHRTS